MQNTVWNPVITAVALNVLCVALLWAMKLAVDGKGHRLLRRVCAARAWPRQALPEMRTVLRVAMVSFAVLAMLGWFGLHTDVLAVLTAGVGAGSLAGALHAGARAAGQVSDSVPPQEVAGHPRPAAQLTQEEKRIDRVLMLAPQVDVHLAMVRFELALSKVPNVSRNPRPQVTLLERSASGSVIALSASTKPEHYLQVYSDTKETVEAVCQDAGWPAIRQLQRTPTPRV